MLECRGCKLEQHMHDLYKHVQHPSMYKHVHDLYKHVQHPSMYKHVHDLYKHVQHVVFRVDMLSNYCNIVVPPNADAAIASHVRQLEDLISPNARCVFVLMNIELTERLYSIQHFLCRLFDWPVHSNCMRLLASMADWRLSRDEDVTMEHTTLLWCVKSNVLMTHRNLEHLYL